MAACRRSPEFNGWISNHAPTVAVDLHNTPGAIREIEVDSPAVLGYSEENRVLTPVKLGFAFEMPQYLPHVLAGWRLLGRVVITAPEQGREFSAP